MIKFHYPIRKADKTPFTDANELYQALEGETTGHYLLGNHKFWHGGIHITDQSAPQCVLDDALCCIADGEVVAYRLNDDYRETSFGDAGQKLKYSNSFCLVRHEYQSAPNPEEGANKDKRNRLTFYSLYMHLLPYRHYRLSAEERPTPKVTMNVGDFYAYDVAPASGPKPPACGKLSRGTKLEVLDQAENGSVTYAKGKIISGSVKDGASTTRGAGDEVWFAYLNNGAPYRNAAGQPIWTADALPERVKPKYWKGTVIAKATKRLPLYNAPGNPIDGQPAGTRKGNAELCVTSEVKFDSRKVLTLMIGNQPQRMAECTLVSGGCWGPEPVPATFWTIVENEGLKKTVNWGEVAPQGFDEVVSVGTAIKAGDPVGYLGYIENLKNEDGETTSKFQVHLEVFATGAEVNDFLQNAAGLKTGKQYLHLPSATVLKKKAPATDSLSLTKKHVIDLSAAPLIQDGGEDCYDISVVENGRTISGVLKKSDADIITQHDWEKLGFQIVEESNAMADGFVDPDDMPQFFRDLFAKIDTDGDGTAEPDELKAAMRDPATRDQLTRLVARHPTEWKEKSDSPKWSRLDQLLASIPKTLQHEKQRLDNFVFWDQLSGRAQMASSLIWHFHPISFIDNFTAVHDDNDLKWLNVENGQLTFDVEGNDIEDASDPLHKYFSRKVHWPGGASGITIGRGYDLGQRPNPQSDLAAVDIGEPLLSWLIGAKGLQGVAAKNYLASASSEIKSIFITRKQQYELFVPVYQFMKRRVIEVSSKNDTVEAYGALTWETIDTKIQDMVVDLIYRGDYTTYSRTLLQRHFVTNNYEGFKNIIDNAANWPDVPTDRFNRRVEFLR